LAHIRPLAAGAMTHQLLPVMEEGFAGTVASMEDESLANGILQQTGIHNGA